MTIEDLKIHCGLPNHKESLIYPEILGAFEGKKFSEAKILTLKNGGKTAAEKRLVLEGAGMVNLDNLEESREWGQYLNHYLLIARLGEFLAKELQKHGEQIDPVNVVNLIFAIFLGKRVRKEADLYQEAPLNQRNPMPTELRVASEMVIGMNIPDDIKQLMEIWQGAKPFPDNEKLANELVTALYADISCTDDITKIPLRLARQFYDRFILPARKELVKLEDVSDIYSKCLEKAVLDYHKDSEGDIHNCVTNFKDLLKKLFDAKYHEENVFSPTLDPQYSLDYVLRGSLDIYIKGETLMQKNGISTGNFSNHYPPMPKWERVIREKHLAAVEEKAFISLDALMSTLTTKFYQEFPQDKWWGRELVRRYEAERDRKLQTETTQQQIANILPKVPKEE